MTVNNKTLFNSTFLSFIFDFHELSLSTAIFYRRGMTKTNQELSLYVYL